MPLELPKFLHMQLHRILIARCTCRLLDKKLEPEVLNEIIAEAVEIERGFICESLPCNLIGMNADYMKVR